MKVWRMAAGSAIDRLCRTRPLRNRRLKWWWILEGTMAELLYMSRRGWAIMWDGTGQRKFGQCKSQLPSKLQWLAPVEPITDSRRHRQLTYIKDFTSPSSKSFIILSKSKLNWNSSETICFRRVWMFWSRVACSHIVNPSDWGAP